MKWFGRLLKKMVRLAVITSALTIVVILLDALLSPDGNELDRS